MPAGDDERLNAKLASAKAYVKSAAGKHEVPDEVMADCIISCAADLYNSRNARLGVMSLSNASSEGTVDAVHVSTDPLRSVWPKLNAVGVPTGRFVVA
ncbi:hypothetical protein OZX62_01575 [Bifidobacterium sp. ESL0690]|uniref:hypothetical protein n=1 Tax=Bifidobacterium sp. ESL0690 TaxID=2983214 RepID=UPI0023F81861|nr:hypothetical protein [Bifidobacterium sp. ESL0690]WEV47015.1 hypothetical protein OZX62_01575 [Bifidobacterium sp. ESL0690]